MLKTKYLETRKEMEKIMMIYYEKGNIPVGYEIISLDTILFQLYHRRDSKNDEREKDRLNMLSQEELDDVFSEVFQDEETIDLNYIGRQNYGYQNKY